MVGKAENSSGFSIHSATIRISTDRAMEKASPRSIMKAGIGRKKMHRIAMIPSAKPMSRLLFFTGVREAIAACCAMGHPRWNSGEHGSGGLRQAEDVTRTR